MARVVRVVVMVRVKWVTNNRCGYSEEDHMQDEGVWWTSQCIVLKSFVLEITFFFSRGRLTNKVVKYIISQNKKQRARFGNDSKVTTRGESFLRLHPYHHPPKKLQLLQFSFTTSQPQMALLMQN